MLRRLISLGMVLLLVGALLTGCGTAKTSNVSAANAPIKIALSPWPGWYPWYIVQEKGFFKKYGVNVQLVWFPVYSDSLQALNTGKVDANCQTLSDTLAPVSKGLPLKAVMVNDNSAGADGFVVKPQYNSVADLKGKKVATELGTVDQLLMDTALAKYGMTESDINYSNMTVNDAGPAFIAGNLDGAVLWQPFLSKAIDEGKGKLVFSSADTPGLIPDLLVFNNRIIQNRPEDVKKILMAWFDAMQWWKQHPDEGDAIVAKKAGVSVADYKKMLAGVKLFTIQDNIKAFTKSDGFESLATTGQKTAEFLKNEGMLDSVPNIDSMLDPRFVHQIAAKQK